MANNTEKYELLVETVYNPSTQRVVAERYYLNGLLHRFGDFPAIIKYDAETGKQTECAHYKQGKQHRVGGPALVQIDPQTDILIKELYFIDGLNHRDGDHPAAILRDGNTGNILVETYVVGGLLHRKSGPAKIYYGSESGEVYQQRYFHRGQQRKATKPNTPKLG